MKITIADKPKEEKKKKTLDELEVGTVCSYKDLPLFSLVAVRDSYCAPLYKEMVVFSNNIPDGEFIIHGNRTLLREKAERGEYQKAYRIKEIILEELED